MLHLENVTVDVRGFSCAMYGFGRFPVRSQKSSREYFSTTFCVALRPTTMYDVSAHVDPKYSACARIENTFVPGIGKRNHEAKELGETFELDWNPRWFHEDSSILSYLNNMYQ